jgi:hypothetical protein
MPGMASWQQPCVNVNIMAISYNSYSLCTRLPQPVATCQICIASEGLLRLQRRRALPTESLEYDAYQLRMGFRRTLHPHRRARSTDMR